MSHTIDAPEMGRGAVRLLTTAERMDAVRAVAAGDTPPGPTPVGDLIAALVAQIAAVVTTALLDRIRSRGFRLLARESRDAGGDAAIRLGRLVEAATGLVPTPGERLAFAEVLRAAVEEAMP